MSSLTTGTDLGLSEEQQDFARAVRDFCDRECGPERLKAVSYTHLTLPTTPYV